MIETPRLVLRPFLSKDYFDFCRYRFSPEIAEGLDEEIVDKAEYPAFFSRYMQNSSYYAIVYKEENVVIGHIKLYPADNHMDLTWKMGCALHKDYWSNGYATESLRYLFYHMFQRNDVHRITSICDCRNVASWHMLEKLGMRREGVYLSCFKDRNGQWQDEYYYAITQKEFLESVADDGALAGDRKIF